MKLKSPNQSHFAQVPRAEIPRSVFDRSCGHKTAFDAGYLVPVFVDEALPGDTFTLSMTSFARLATPIVPVMDNMYQDTMFFAVPIRLLWDNWQKFNGEQLSPGDSTDYLVPQVTPPVGGFTVNSIFDYFGLPTGVDNISVSAFWSRAYNFIHNEWFRDQNLQTPAVVDKGDGPDLSTNYPLRRRGKRHDYFTSCLPWPQKGPSVLLPLGFDAPITGIGWAPGATMTPMGATVRETGGIDATYVSGVPTMTGFPSIQEDPANPGYPNIYANLADATASNINVIRQAFQVQRMYERDARGGTRYIEILKAHFGVVSPDARLQRPEYLGGGSTQISFNAVAQTSGTGTYAETPLGSLGAYATSLAQNHGFSKSFTEHCVIIGLVSIRADMTYQQGINRMFSRRTRFDFAWPALAHLGEQAVLNKEIYAQGTAVDDEVFGYQERNAEYRYKPSIITGELRSQFAQSLDVWHLAQDFTELPLLNGTFIEENPPVDRVIVVQDEPHFLFDSYFRLKCARPLPVYGVPGMIDHF